MLRFDDQLHIYRSFLLAGRIHVSWLFSLGNPLTVKLVYLSNPIDTE
jgi:hypothetical protein